MLLGLQAVAQPWCPCLSRANTASDKTQKLNGSGRRRAEPSFPKLPLCTLQMSFCGQVEGKSSTMWEKLSTSPGEGGVYSREHCPGRWHTAAGPPGHPQPLESQGSLPSHKHPVTSINLEHIVTALGTHTTLIPVNYKNEGGSEHFLCFCFVKE